MNLRPLKIFFLVVLVGVLTGRSNDIKGQDIPTRPSPPRLVNDYTSLLNPSEIDALERKLVAYNDSTTNQITILIVPSVQPYDISEYGLKVLREWGIGTQKNNNGVLITVAREDRKVNIATGYGLEGALPDIICKTIIENDIIPAFRKGQSYEGLDKATDDIILAARGEYVNNHEGKQIPLWLLILLIILIFFFLIMLLKIARMSQGQGSTILTRRGAHTWDSGGWGSTGGGWFSGGSGGGSDWGGGGGGFGGFGGGSGGGGGASGSW